MGNLVTIKSANYATELAVAKSYLEDNDIPCFFKNDLSSQVYTVTAASGGGAQLQVDETDFERAVLLLIEGGFAKKEDYKPSSEILWLTNLFERIGSFFKKK